jgi:hypothetical protein
VKAGLDGIRTIDEADAVSSPLHEARSAPKNRRVNPKVANMEEDLGNGLFTRIADITGVRFRELPVWETCLPHPP